MARGEFWIKLHVDLLDDVKLIGRPDSDFKLWVSLLLLAKQSGDDGVIHRLGPSALRERFGLQCPTRKVIQALDHFAASKMIALDNGDIHILNYDKRQSVKDFHEKNAERQKRYRDSNVTRNATVTLRSNAQIRSEEIRSDQIPPKPPHGGATRLRRSRFEKPPAIPACNGCRELGHTLADCPRKAEFANEG